MSELGYQRIVDIVNTKYGDNILYTRFLNKVVHFDTARFTDADRNNIFRMIKDAHCDALAIRANLPNFELYNDRYSDLLWNLSETLNISYTSNDTFVSTCNKFFKVFQNPPTPYNIK